MTDDRVGDKYLAVRVIIKTPGIRHAVHGHFDDMATRMIPPNARIHRDAMNVLGTGYPNVRCSQNSLPTIEPTVWPPLKPVGNGVGGSFNIESIQHNLWRTIRHIIGISVGYEK